MAENFAYHYAEVDNATNMCIGVVDTSDPGMEGPTGVGSFYVAIPVDDPEYLFKYYINDSWYEDAEGTIPWQSSLL